MATDIKFFSSAGGIPLITPCGYHMRCQYFPLLVTVFIRAQSECPVSRQVGSFIGSVSTASSLAIGSMYTRGARYSYEGRVLLTVNHCIKLAVKG